MRVFIRPPFVTYFAFLTDIQELSFKDTFTLCYGQKTISLYKTDLTLVTIANASIRKDLGSSPTLAMDLEGRH